MSILDDIEIIKRMDSSDNLGRLDSLPKIIEGLHSLNKKADIKFPRELDNIYITGDTDGIISGYLLQTLLLFDILIPIIVDDTESIPGFIGEKTLVLAIFQSPPKENVVEKINRCIEKEAATICITEKGVNLDDIRQAKVLEIPVDFRYCFQNHYIFVSLLPVLSRNNLIKNFDSDLDETVRVLDYLKGDYSLTVPTRSNPAKELAMTLYQSVIYFYSSWGKTDFLAKRWSLQLRRNSYLIECSIFPDASYEQPFLSIPNIDLERRIVFLMDKADDYRIINKYDELRNIAIQKNVDVIELYGTGRSKLSKMMSLNFLSDFVNGYLSFLKDTKNH